MEMIWTYYRIAFRRLQKNSLYSLINLTGLTLGIASCLLIGLFIINETSYDRFNKNAARIVRMTMEFGEGGLQKVALTGTKAGPQLARTFPQVESFVRTINDNPVVKYGQSMHNEKHFLYADSTFFKIFSFQLLRGDPATVLDAPDKVVLTKKTAQRYFGNADPVGRTIRVNGHVSPKTYQVTGIVADPPENSQIKFDFIASFTSMDASRHEEWWTANYVTYLLLHDPGQLAGFRRQLMAYMRDVSSKDLKLPLNSPLIYNLEPLVDVHLYSSLDGLEPNGSATTVYILGIIALLILVIAGINYTNLATVQSSAKSTEIGIRKVLGATKSQLFGQFIGESFLLTFIASLVAVVLTLVSLPYFNQLTGKELSFSSVLTPLPLLAMIILCACIAFVSGGYPAFVLSNAKLIGILRSGLKLTARGGVFRQGLIVFQFSVSICLIIATIVVVQQLGYVRHKDLGYDKDHVIAVSLDSYVRSNYEGIKNQIAQLPGVVNISGANAIPAFVQWGDGISADNGHGKINMNITCLPSDLGFIKTMNMKLIAGSDFIDNEFKLMDTAGKWKNFRYSVILNQTAAAQLGWSAEQAVGKTIEKGVPATVVGVIKDFHFSSLHQPIGPMMLFLDTSFTNYYMIRIAGDKIPTTLQALQAFWKVRVPTMPIEYRFLDEDFNNMYSTEQKTAAVFSIFSSLAIVLACMGLFALSAFATLQRSKEIGIRKVLGASVASIISLVARDFLKLTFIAVVIATPFAWYMMNGWLQNFAYRIHLQVWVFLATGCSAILIAFITISFQSVKAAMANPVRSLRSE